jgi:hypothetical protein
MSARHDLGRLIWETSSNDEQSISATGANIVAAAILAAGYRKPRTITTEAELHALCDGSAVSAAGDVHIKNGRWVDRLGEFSPAWLLLEMGVVTVVYEEPSGE